MSTYKFIKIPDPEYPQFDRSRIEFTVEVENLPSLLEEFESFLRASGFMVKHDTLQIVEDEN